MKLTEKVLAGDVRAAAKLMRELEDEVPGATEELEALYPHTGRAHVIGLSGAPGVGKSTLVDSLIGVFRQKNMTIGVIAIDPTSPFTGGAILADRIRMRQRSTDKDIFIRSTATRGWAGGLSKASLSMIHVFDAMGKDIILVETAGTGQGEVDICWVADTTVIVLSPSSGDEMQMIKAGIMEIADIFAINKADKGGADNIATAIEVMLRVKEDSTSNKWKPSVLLTEAVSDKGAEELVDEILKHKEFLVSSGELEKCRWERARFELMATLESFIGSYVSQERAQGGYIENLVDDLTRRKISPSSAAQEVIARFTKQFKSATV